MFRNRTNETLLSGANRLLYGAMLVVLALNSMGCATIRVTDPPRTATEQFLLSTAAREAVQQLNFDPLRARNVFVDTQYFAASEQAFVMGELRARMFLEGVRLVTEREQAEIVIEVRSGGVGIDREDFLLGIPSIPLTAGDTTQVPLATPEISILKNTDQLGVASVAFVAYWRESGEVVGFSGPFIGSSMRDDWWFFGVGPQTVGDIPPVEVEAEE